MFAALVNKVKLLWHNFTLFIMCPHFNWKRWGVGCFLSIMLFLFACWQASQGDTRGMEALPSVPSGREDSVVGPMLDSDLLANSKRQAESPIVKGPFSYTPITDAYNAWVDKGIPTLPEYEIVPQEKVRAPEIGALVETRTIQDPSRSSQPEKRATPSSQVPSSGAPKALPSFGETPVSSKFMEAARRKVNPFNTPLDFDRQESIKAFNEVTVPWAHKNGIPTWKPIRPDWKTCFDPKTGLEYRQHMQNLVDRVKNAELVRKDGSSF